MKFALIDLAVKYINVLCPHTPTKLVSTWSIKKTKPGLIEFVVYKNRFPTSDTLGEMLKQLTKSFGCAPHHAYATTNTQGYRWSVGPARAVFIEHRRGVGTFIQLTDEGN
jgi:hypothetical protein